MAEVRGTAQGDAAWLEASEVIARNAVRFERDLHGGATGSPFFRLGADELAELAALAALPPSARGYAQIRRLISLLCGADVLLQLDEDEQAIVAAALRYERWAQGLVLRTDLNATDGSFVALAHGKLTVLVRDTSVESQRGPLRHVLPGECFAEAHLIEHATTAPSLVAAEPSGVLCLSRADYAEARDTWHRELLERKVEALQAAACFATADRRALRALAERMQTQRVHAD
jgi:CRP-like cAMP-binding protein